jgi:hypothetical protein
VIIAAILILFDLWAMREIQLRNAINVKHAYLKGYMDGRKDGDTMRLDVSLDKDLNDKLSTIATMFHKYNVPEKQAEVWAKVVCQSAKIYQIPELVLVGIILQESGCNPQSKSKAKHPASGLTQVTWHWWKSYLTKEEIAQSEMDLHNPIIGIRAGATVLRYLLDIHKGDMRKALRAYSGNAAYYEEKIQRRVQDAQ